MLCQFHLADLQCYTHPLEQIPFGIKHFITYVTSYQSQNDRKKNSNKPVDPSNFLWVLKRKLFNLRGVPFDFKTQEDVAEISQVVLDELKGVYLAASQLISNTQKIIVSCNTCFCSSESEETLGILFLPVLLDIEASINQFLKPETLSSQNKWVCPSCRVLSESTRETCIINSAPILIIQLCRFSNQCCQLTKGANFCNWTQSRSNKHLVVSITVEDEISYTKKYSLIVTINHSGGLNRGHYLMLKKGLSTILHHTFLLQKSLNVPRDLPKIHLFIYLFFATRICHFTHCLWMWQVHISPNSSLGIEFAHSIFWLYNPAEFASS